MSWSGGAEIPEIRPMKRKRRHLSAEFKARVAKEALKEEKSIQQIAQDNEIAPYLIWVSYATSLNTAFWHLNH